MKRVIGTFCFFMLFFSSFAQIDNLFWFAAPDITAGHAHNPMTFCVTSFGNPATVTITQPANPSFNPVTINLNAYSYYALDVTSQESTVETAPENTVCNYGFKIESTDKISTYYQLGANNSEIYTLKGRNALGTDFIVPMENYLNTGSFTPPAYSSIEIVATENNTTVTIIPSQPLLGGAPANVPITITLNRGQSYCVKSASQNASAHLANTRITSDKPIAVNSSDDSAASNSFSGYSGQDLVGEQIVPVNLAGDMFVALWNNRAFEGVCVFPTQDTTHVYINGSTTPSATLNVGQEYIYMLNQSPTIATMITTDKPSFVFQLTGSDGEAGGTILPGLGCTGSEEIVYARPSYSTNMKISVVTKTSYVNGFTMVGGTGTLTASDFTTLPYDPTWSYCFKDFSSAIPIQTVMRISNNLGPFHVGILDYYSGMSSSLGYFSGYNNSGRINFLMNNIYCLHDDITFNYVSDGVDTIKLITPSGDTLTQEPFVLHSVDLSDTGYYYVIARSLIGCEDNWARDSIRIQVVNSYKPDLGPDRYICTGDLICINSNYNVPNTNFYWNTGDRDSAIYVVSGGEYILRVSMNNLGTSAACIGYDTINVFVYAHPHAKFEANRTEGCSPVNVIFNNLTTPDTLQCAYYWTVWNEDGTLAFQSSVKNPTYLFTQNGAYSVKLKVISQDGCVDSIIKWNYINIYPQPEVDFSADPEISLLSDNGGLVNFTSYLSDNIVGNANNHFTWDFGDGNIDSAEYNPAHTYTTWGDYDVIFTFVTQGGCNVSVGHKVVIEANLIFPNVITPNGDGYNDVFAIENLNVNINPEDPDEYRTNDLYIYDRWGRRVYKAHNYDTYKKDGQLYIGSQFFNGDGLADGVYYFSFYYKGKDKVTDYHGSLSIIR